MIGGIDNTRPWKQRMRHRYIRSSNWTNKWSTSCVLWRRESTDNCRRATTAAQITRDSNIQRTRQKIIINVFYLQTGKKGTIVGRLAAKCAAMSLPLTYVHTNQKQGEKIQNKKKFKTKKKIQNKKKISRSNFWPAYPNRAERTRYRSAPQLNEIITEFY